MTVKRLLADSSRSCLGFASEPEVKTGVGILEGVPVRPSMKADDVGLGTTGDSALADVVVSDRLKPSADTLFCKIRSFPIGFETLVEWCAGTMSSPGSNEKRREGWAE